MTKIGHICRECSIRFMKAKDYILHRHEHHQKDKKEKELENQ